MTQDKEEIEARELGLRQVEFVTKTIDRVFRTVEMIAIASLVAAAGVKTSTPALVKLSTGLSILAGAYIMYPILDIADIFARKLMRHGKLATWFTFVLATIIGLSSFYYSFAIVRFMGSAISSVDDDH